MSLIEAFFPALLRWHDPYDPLAQRDVGGQGGREQDVEPEENQAELNAASDLVRLFTAAAKNQASDIHLKTGSPPLFRIQNRLIRAKLEPLSHEVIMKLLGEVLDPKKRREIEDSGSVDFAVEIPGLGRFRINVFRQRGAISMTARRVQLFIPKLEDLHLPQATQKLVAFEAGLVIIAGITGAGKSTTLASLIEIINQTSPYHIITIEDPIEYYHRDAKSAINQREVGVDVPDFHLGLRVALRQDPDVIMVGEMRDWETVETALMAAETGHLVFTTIHSGSAPQTIGRLLDFFPQNQHYQIRQQLFFNLKAILVQKLIPGRQAKVPRVPMTELMLATPPIRKLITENQDQKIGEIIRTSRQEGMQDFNQSLVDLIHQGLIAETTALEASPNPEQLAMNLKGIVLGADRGAIG